MTEALPLNGSQQRTQFLCQPHTSLFAFKKKILNAVTVLEIMDNWENSQSAYNLGM